VDERPVSPDTRGSIGLIVIVLAAALYFGLPYVASGWPPAYVRVGPLEFGQIVGTTCHGFRVNGDMAMEFCK